MSFRDIINLGNPSHEQNIKLSDIFLSPIHHLCYTQCLFYVLILISTAALCVDPSLLLLHLL